MSGTDSSDYESDNDIKMSRRDKLLIHLQRRSDHYARERDRFEEKHRYLTLEYTNLVLEILKIFIK